MSYVTYLSDIFFYGCILVAIAEYFGLVSLNEEQNQVFNFLIIFSGFIGLINVIMFILQEIVKLSQS